MMFCGALGNIVIVDLAAVVNGTLMNRVFSVISTGCNVF